MFGIVSISEFFVIRLWQIHISYDDFVKNQISPDEFPYTVNLFGESYYWNTRTYLVYIELLVTLYLVAYDLTFDGHRSCVRQHMSNFTSGPKSKYVSAMSPLPHHFVPRNSMIRRVFNRFNTVYVTMRHFQFVETSFE